MVGAVRDREVMGKKSMGGMLRQEDLRRERQGKMGDHRVEERINPKWLCELWKSIILQLKSIVGRDGRAH